MEQNVILCCGPKIWTRVVGWLRATAVYYAIQVPLGMDQMSSMLRDMGLQEEAAFWDRSSTGVYVTLFMFCIFSVLVDTMLLTGNEREMPGLLLPWLILSWISMALIGIVLLICLFIGFLAGFLVFLIASILPAIFLYAVHKRYAELKEMREPRIPVPIYKV